MGCVMISMMVEVKIAKSCHPWGDVCGCGVGECMYGERLSLCIVPDLTDAKFRRHETSPAASVRAPRPFGSQFFYACSAMTVAHTI